MRGKKTLTAERIAAIKERDIDVSDIPELTKADFATGHFRNWKSAKKAISLRIDLDNLEWLKQKRMNEVLRWVRQNGCPLA